MKSQGRIALFLMSPLLSMGEQKVATPKHLFGMEIILS